MKGTMRNWSVLSVGAIAFVLPAIISVFANLGGGEGKDTPSVKSTKYSQYEQQCDAEMVESSSQKQAGQIKRTREHSSVTVQDPGIGESANLGSPEAFPNGDIGVLSETEASSSLTLVSPDGNWSAYLDQDGTLHLTQTRSKTQSRIEAWTDVLPEVSFSADSKKLAFPQRRVGTESDIMVISIPPDGEARAVVEWASSEDRPSFSPDGKRLSFVSGRTGIASIYVVDLERPGTEPKQITNAGLENAVRLTGEPPDGFVPPPDQNGMRWIGNTLNWTGGNEVYQVEVQ